MNSLWNTVTEGGRRKPYGGICSEELSEREDIKDSPCLKCTDNLYLVIKDQKPLLFDSRYPERGLTVPESFPETEDLTGFLTELSFAPDVILPAEFERNTLKLADTVFALTVRKISEKLYALQSDNDADLILFDASRFLLYTVTGGEFALGYAEV